MCCRCSMTSLSPSPLSFCLSLPPSLSPVGNYRTGATGKVMAGVELKIDNPGPNGDGELCFRGRHVFMGYLREERKTREAIDEDGWLHSGDIGRLDKDGKKRQNERKNIIYTYCSLLELKLHVNNEVKFSACIIIDLMGLCTCIIFHST